MVKKCTEPVKEDEILHVWLVDDHDGVRQSLAAMLGLEPRLNCARQFSSANELLLALQIQAPDVVLLDVQMPGISGVDAIAPIKKLAPLTSVLMLTSFADHASKEQSLAAGASDYLLKTDSLGEICAAIFAAKQGEGSIRTSNG